MVQWHWPSGSAQTGWQSDRGLAYADGVFDTLRVSAHGPVLAEQHRDRLLSGCRTLGLSFGAAEWTQWWHELNRRGWLSASDAGGHIVKIIVTRGSGGRGYRPPDRPHARVVSALAPLPPLPSGAVKLHLCRTPVTVQPGGGLKTLNRLDQVLAARELPQDCFEGLMTDAQGRPVEGTRSNIFAFTDNILYTPPSSQLAVSGVMRAALVRGLPGIGLQVKERPLTFEQLRRSQGAFIVNSVMGVVPVAAIGCFSLGYAVEIADIQSFTKQHFGI